MNKTCGTPFLVVNNRLFQSGKYPEGPSLRVQPSTHIIACSRRFLRYSIHRRPCPPHSCSSRVAHEYPNLRVDNKYVRTWLPVHRRMYLEPRHQARPSSVCFVYGKRTVYSYRTNGKCFLYNCPSFFSYSPATAKVINIFPGE